MDQLRRNRLKHNEKSFIPEWLRYKSDFDNKETNILIISFSVPAIITMLYIYLLPTAGSWSIFGLYMFIFASTGLSAQLLIDATNATNKGAFRLKPLDMYSGFRALIIFAILFIIQRITSFEAQLSLTIVEKALYYVFAAVSEEMFFRGLVIRGMLRIKKHAAMAVLGIIISTVLFALIHVSYYNNTYALTVVVLSGVVLSVIYVTWKDLTANIIAHFIINVFVARMLFVML